MRNLVIVAISSCLLSFSGCSQQEAAKSSVSSTIVTIDGEPIPNSQTETGQTRQALYEHLCQMYDIRRSAAEAYATACVLKTEADKMGLPPDSFVHTHIAARLTEQAMNETVNDEIIGDWIEIESDDGDLSVPTGSSQGFAELRRRTMSRLRQSLIDSLFEAHHVVIDINVPQGPIKELKDCVTEPAGSQCDVIVSIVYDLDCVSCRKVWRMLKNVVPDFGGKVGIEMIDATSGSSFAERMASSARRHGVSAEFAAWLLDQSLMPDSITMAGQLAMIGVENNALFDDLTDSDLTSEAERRQSQLADMGLLATPKILLNHRLLWRGHEAKILRHEISRILYKKQ